MSELQPASEFVQQTQRLTLLVEVGELVLEGAPDEAALVSRIYSRIAGHLAADIGIFLRRDRTDRHRVAWATGLSDHARSVIDRLAAGAPFCAEAGPSGYADSARIAAEASSTLTREIGSGSFACHPLFSRAGRPLGMFCVGRTGGAEFTDDERAFLQTVCHTLSVTFERQRAEDALRSSQEQLRLFIEHAPAAVAMLDREMRYLAVSKRWLEDYRLEGPILGRDHYEVFPEQPDEWKAIHRRCLAGAVEQSFEDRFERENGDVQFLRWEVRPWRATPDRIGGIIIFTEDITKWKKAEEEQRRHEIEMRTLADNSPDIVARFDRQFRYVFVNATITSVAGMDPESFIGKTNSDIGMPIELCQQWESALSRVFRSATGETIQFNFPSERGTVRFESKLVPEFDERGVLQHVLVISRDFTDTWNTSRALARAKEAAESATAAKDRFLAVLSHELRTPLTPIRIALSEWLSRPDIPADVVENVRMIQRNVDVECRLIDDMLDLNRIVRGKLTLRRENIHVPELIQHSLRTVSADAAAKHLELVVVDDAVAPVVSGDAARLQQVLWNLLRNAIKFTPDGGRVEVRTSNPSADTVRISVRDSGVGIDPSRLVSIFDAFDQGDESIARRFGGLGLGLAISKALVEMHGGTLVAASKGLGHGAEFAATLAVGSAAERPTERPAAPSVAPSAPAVPEALDPSDVRILLVEDHQDTARAMHHMLSRRGFDVETAGTMAEAFAAFEQRPFDLLLCDLGLPDGDGNALVRELQRRAPVKAIALSGFGMDEDVRNARDAGFAAHITKPVAFEHLVATIARVLRGTSV